MVTETFRYERVADGDEIDREPDEEIVHMEMVDPGVLGVWLRTTTDNRMKPLPDAVKETENLEI